MLILRPENAYKNHLPPANATNKSAKSPTARKRYQKVCKFTYRPQALPKSLQNHLPAANATKKSANSPTARKRYQKVCKITYRPQAPPKSLQIHLPPANATKKSAKSPTARKRYQKVCKFTYRPQTLPNVWETLYVEHIEGDLADFLVALAGGRLFCRLCGSVCGQ